MHVIYYAWELTLIHTRRYLERQQCYFGLLDLEERQNRNIIEDVQCIFTSTGLKYLVATNFL